MKRERHLVPTQSVEHLLLEHLQALTPAERTLASMLLEDYPVLGLSTVTEIAEAAGVSAPTVVRMARKLGFDGFTEMQRTIRQEVSASIKDPIKRHDTWHSDGNDAHIINRFSDAISSNVRNTLQRLDTQSFDAVAKMLADPDRQIFLTGGRITRSIADYLYNHLQIIRPHVTHLGTSANVWPQYVVDMNKQSVVLLFDIRRYESDLEKLAKLSRDRGADVVLLTDQWGSPISRLSSHKFHALVEAPSSWDSTIAVLLIVEALIAQVQKHCWQDSKSRIEELETMFGKTRLFKKPG